MINLFDIIPLKGDPLELPEFEKPHFVAAEEAMYLRKNTLFGEVMLKQDKMPTHLSKMGEYSGGLLRRSKGEIDKIPAHIISQALDFFRKVYTAKSAEAEVLILYNKETKKFKLFVPYQHVSGTSVNSVYDPRDIPAGYVEVGTIHSHCEMGAFHSGTDTGDASNFNGLHLTVGHVMTGPEYAAMVMINKVRWDFPIGDVADIELNNTKAPKEWMNFIGSPRDIKLALVAKGFDEVEKWFDSVTRSYVNVKKITALTAPYKKDKKKKVINTTPYPTDKVKLSSELADFVPEDWLNPSFLLREGFLEQAFEEKLERLREAMSERGYDLFFDFAKKLPTDSVEKFWEKVEDTRQTGIYTHSMEHYSGKHDDCHPGYCNIAGALID
jgi:hypothetical protein